MNQIPTQQEREMFILQSIRDAIKANPKFTDDVLNIVTSTIKEMTTDQIYSYNWIELMLAVHVPKTVRNKILKTMKTDDLPERVLKALKL